MYTATLLTAPENPVLHRDHVENLRSAWGGGDTVWLAPGEAAEFALKSRPKNLWPVWEYLQKLAVDLVLQPSDGRRKHMLLADMDSTMIRQECIDELAAEAGVGDRVAAITARAMNGELEFEAALRERVGLLKGQKLSVIDTVLAERITMMPGAETLIATMKSLGCHTALVSGGFTVFSAAVAAALGFDEHRANRLQIEGGKLTGRVLPPILGSDAKVAALDDIANRLGLTADQVLAVGDGANDLGMLKRAGTGVALHAKPVVAAQCDIRINHGDLTALLYLQGYCRDQFVAS